MCMAAVPGSAARGSLRFHTLSYEKENQKKTDKPSKKRQSLVTISCRLIRKIRNDFPKKTQHRLKIDYMSIELCSLNITNILEDNEKMTMMIIRVELSSNMCLSLADIWICLWYALGARGPICPSFSRRLNLNNAIYWGNSQIVRLLLLLLFLIP